MKQQQIETVKLNKVVGGGQTMGTLADGRKVFAWGGLPDELVELRITKSKSKMAEAVVTKVIEPSPERVEPQDPESYLSTSPWQIVNFDSEQAYKASMIREAFEMHRVDLPEEVEVYSDGVQYGYRNKIEFSWYGDTKDGKNTSDHAEQETLDLAFFRRGSKGKIPVEGMSLARPEINELARKIRDLLHSKQIEARTLKTLLIRSDQKRNCVWQLYIKDKVKDIILDEEAGELGAQGGEVIFSDPRSPASRVTKRLAKFGDVVLEDAVLSVPFRYACEGFFQVNLPVYEQTLRDMSVYLEEVRNKDEMARESTVIDLYSGVGSIGLTIGGDKVTLIEIDENAVREMYANVKRLGKKADIVHASAEFAVDSLHSNACIIVDPPRAGLHRDVIDRLLEVKPPRIIYLSCNPVTQARDTALLLEGYKISHHRGYNFFPRTPHIEHLVILDKI